MPSAVDGLKPVMVAVFNQKGGVAKTTTSINIAVCLAAYGYRVLLVDLDTQGNATTAFGLDPLPAIGAFEIIVSQASLAEAVHATVYPGLSLLPATMGLRSGEPLLVHAARRRFLLMSRLAGAAFDIVIVDCPPALGAATGTALASATAVLMPARPDPYAHDGLINTWGEIKRIGGSGNIHLASAGILLTMTASEPAGTEVARVIRAEFGAQVYAVEIATDPRVAEAAQMSMPVTVLDPDGLAGRAYVDATAELLRRLAQQHRPGVRLGPPLGRDHALNTLREWRATIHGALRRLPTEGGAWVQAKAPDADTELEMDGDADDPYGIAVATNRPERGRMLPLLLGLGLGLALGLVMEAVTGLTSRLLK
jgi:chromosome partitioning protein